jgi:hypothetical protein
VISFNGPYDFWPGANYWWIGEGDGTVAAEH